MEKRIHILFVEDSPEDVELEERALKASGLAFSAQRVETAEAIRLALAQFKPDLVISDYSMPGLDGLNVLRIVRSLDPEVPFIYVSGTIGEERAIESLKNGATDYVVKGRLEALPMKVQRALREGRERKEHRTLEEQFRRAQKMEVVGRLAGGVAHDFNNILTVIIGNGDLTLTRLPDDHPARRFVEEIKRAGERGATLTRQLLMMSRRQPVAPKVLNLNDVVADTEKMLVRLIGEDIDLASVRAPDLPRVLADPGQVEQVLMNLAVNARDAMPGGGKLTIETTKAEVDAGYAAMHTGAKPGRYVRLTVSDTGSGMDKETLSRLFEPFFTTKPAGKGTGLGLSIVYGIVHQAGGYIEVYSEPGRGTSFKILLPVAQVEPPAPRPETPRPIRMHGTESILVVEDEPSIRALIVDVLSDLGYRVEAVGETARALTILDAGGTVDLLVTDLVLPGMGGAELAAAARIKRPSLRVLYMSGYTDAAVERNGHIRGGDAFMQKPFSPNAFALKVRELLEAP